MENEASLWATSRLICGTWITRTKTRKILKELRLTQLLNAAWLQQMSLKMMKIKAYCKPSFAFKTQATFALWLESSRTLVPIFTSESTVLKEMACHARRALTWSIWYQTATSMVTTIANSNSLASLKEVDKRLDCAQLISWTRLSWQRMDTCTSYHPSSCRVWFWQTTSSVKHSSLSTILLQIWQKRAKMSKSWTSLRWR